MNDIAVLEPDDAIAIGVTRCHVQHVHFLTVEVQRQRIIECNHGKRFRRCRRDLPVDHAEVSAAGQHLAHIVVRNDHGSGMTEVIVTACVVEVPVSVQYIRDGQVT